jgi:hypothetical protein
MNILEYKKLVERKIIENTPYVGPDLEIGKNAKNILI